jgi:putative FmdB family regulatory protein
LIEYDYKCGKCNLIHTATVPMKDRHRVPCPGCGAPAKFQQIQLGGFTHEERIHPGLITGGERAIEAEYGRDWRETKASKRMKRGEPSDGKIHNYPSGPISPKN